MKLFVRPSFGATLAASACALLLLSTPAMHADTFYNLTFSGSVDGTGTMDLNPTTGQITITLTNTTNLDSSLSSDDNLIAGLIFTLNNAPTSAVTLDSQAGALVDISGTMDPTATADPVTGDPTHWGASNSGHQVCLETAGGGSPDCAGGGQPEDLIITNESNYDVNPSVTNHDPSILGTGTFVITVPGLNADSTVLSASVIYGTNGDADTTTTVTPGTPPSPIPEPSSLLLAGTGLLGAAGALRRRMLGR